MKYRESHNDKKLRNWFVNDLSHQLLRGVFLEKGEIRGLTELNLEFNYPITAIAGRNGTGKSTVLAMVCCGFHNKKNGFKLPHRKLSYFTFADFFIQYREEVPPQGIEISYLIAHDNWRKSERAPDGKGILIQKRKKKKGGRWNDYSARVSRDVVFLGIERIVPHNEKSQSKSYSKSFSYDTDAGWEEDVKNIVGYILNKKYDTFKYATHSKYRLPIVTVSDSKYSGFNMGAGENALFEIFSIMHSCSKGALIVIDEIELGLHTEAQKKFIQKLKEVCLSRKLQVICTTHSKDIFDELPNDARVYIECINGKTKITDSISSDFAFSKLSATNSNELDLLIEDRVAKSILMSVLPNTLRSRVNIEVIGSATALSKQLSALYNRENPRPALVIFDGDQKDKESDNLSLARKMAENTDEDFDDWFLSKIQYLPGDTWPEAWVVQKCTESIDNLSSLTGTDEGQLNDYLEYGLEAGKHNEFYEIGKHLGLNDEDALNRCCINISQRHSDEFQDLIKTIEDKLNG